MSAFALVVRFLGPDTFFFISYYRNIACAMAQDDMSLLRVGQITSDINETLNFLRRNNLLRTAKFCLPCKRFMSHTKDTSRCDLYV